MPIEELLDTLPRVTTAAGRSLINGGGVFPDLEIEGDTLKLVERDFIRASNEAQFPLGLRIAEFSFSVAATRRAAEAPPSVTEAEFESFLEALDGHGLQTDLLADADVRSYLLWRTELAVAQRMGDVAAEADFRTQRDPVLSEAIRLLEDSPSQQGLFLTVDSRAGATQAPIGG